MRRALFAASGLALLSLTAAHTASAQPVTGLYVGAGGGGNFLDEERWSGPKLSPSSQALPKYKTGYVGLGSIGYGFGNGVRVEIEGSYRNNDRKTKSTIDSLKGRETKYGGMANVAFDMDVRSPYIFPYLGAGAGYMSVNERDTSNIAGSPALRLDSSKGAFAYQAFFGASLPIPPVVGLSATIEYRYLGLSGSRKYQETATFGGVSSSFTRRITQDNNHQILVGLRYAFNVTPPTEGTPPAPAPVSAAPAPAARSYLVFFDWDRADLTDRARAIIAEAAAASTSIATTRIEVAGHADRTGTAQYNQDLSRRRAAMVAAELVRKGVAAASISVSSFGDSRPLVPTAAGVREPQNRRVEIVLK